MNKLNVNTVFALLFLSASGWFSWFYKIFHIDFNENKYTETIQLDRAILEDCPYVFLHVDKVSVKWFEEGELIEKSYYNEEYLNLTIETCPAFDAHYLKLNHGEVNNKQHYTGVSKIAALSDIHGKHDLFMRLITANGIVDDKGDWNFGDGHFVIVGDVFDRGDQVMETLWFLYKLEQQAVLAGGKVHLLLGNHEYMVLKGDLRYLHEKYEWVAKGAGYDYDKMFDANTVLGQWLRTKPVAITVNNIAFTHGGFSMSLVEKGLGIKEINKLFHEQIIDQPKDSIMNNDKLKLLVKSNGPIWYRGYFRDSLFTEQKARRILTHLNSTNIVVGHTSRTEVASHHNGLIYSVDSSIKRGEYGEILFWKKNVFTKGTLSGERKNF